MKKIPMPENLSDLITARSNQALADGALFSIETEFDVIEEKGIPFIIRSAHNLHRKRAAQLERQQQNPTDQKTQCREVDSKAKPNPFLPYEEAMYVCDLSDSHVCLLNKFNVVDQHVLIVTKEYEPQEQLLSTADFTAVVPVLQQMDGLVFYNGGQLAGASQHHKHLQFIPKSLASGIQQLPVEMALSVDALPTNRTLWRDQPYPHAITRLQLDWSLPPQQLGAQLYQHYLNTCTLLNIGQQADIQAARHYNLLLTRDWLLCVVRKSEHYRDISLNSLAFAGSFFVRNAGQMQLLVDTGFLTALKDVTEKINFP